MAMMKRLLALGLITMMVFASSACSVRNFESYEAAVEKTEAIESGVEDAFFTLDYTFEQGDLDEATFKKLKDFEHLNLQYSLTYNKTLEQFSAEGYLNLGALGFDTAIYKTVKGTYIYVPLMNRYIQLEEMMASDALKAYAEGMTMEPVLSEESMDEMQALWLSLLNDENVFKGSPVLMETPDGELKATVYEIKLNSEQIQSGLDGAMAIIRKDEQFLAFLKKSTEQQDIAVDVEALLQSGEVDFGGNDIDFNYKAYVDRDGYIINETVEVIIAIQEADSNLKAVTFVMETGLSQKNQINMIESPSFSEANTMRPEDFVEWIEQKQ